MTVGHIWPPLFYSLACSLLPTFGTSQHVVLMLRFCTDTRDTDKAEQFFHEPCLNGIGYHYYIRQSGEVVRTRSLSRTGAHTKGYNRNSIDICYEGGLDKDGKPKDTRTPEQRSAFRQLVNDLLARFPGCKVCGHRDLSPDLNHNGKIDPHEWTKQCPCFDVATEF